MIRYILTFIPVCFFSFHASSQSIPYSEIFSAFNTGSRFEAMGRASTAMGGESNCIWANPAGLTEIKGLHFSSSFAFASKTTTSYPWYYYGYDEAKYLNVSAGWKFNKYLTVAAGINSRNFIQDMKLIVNNADTTVYDLNFRDYAFALASNPWKGFSVGATAHIYRGNYPIPSITSALAIDIGARYKHTMHFGAHEAGFTIASTAHNFTAANAKYTFPENYPITDYSVEMPLFLNNAVALNYAFIPDSSKAAPVRVTLTGEYGLPLNYDFDRSTRVGGEVTLFDLVSLRGGYFTKTINDYGYPDVNRNHLSGFTYGASVQLPLNRLFRKELPVSASLEYASYLNPSYSQTVPSVTRNHFIGLNLKFNIGR